MNVFEKVKEIIVNNLSVSAEKVTLEAHLADDLGADSIDAVQIIMDIEDAFSVTIADEATENIKTVKDLVDYIENETK